MAYRGGGGMGGGPMGGPQMQQYKPKAALQRARTLEKIGRAADACDYLFEVLTSKRMGRCVPPPACRLDSASGRALTAGQGSSRAALRAGYTPGALT